MLETLIGISLIILEALVLVREALIIRETLILRESLIIWEALVLVRESLIIGEILVGILVISVRRINPSLAFTGLASSTVVAARLVLLITVVDFSLALTKLAFAVTVRDAAFTITTFAVSTIATVFGLVLLGALVVFSYSKAFEARLDKRLLWLIHDDLFC